MLRCTNGPKFRLFRLSDLKPPPRRGLRSASAVAARQFEQARLLSPAAAVWGRIRPEYDAGGGELQRSESKIWVENAGTLKYVIG